MYLAYLHGEGVVFSSLIYGFFLLLGGFALKFGLSKYGSKVGAYVAIGYIGFVMACGFLSLNLGSVLLNNIATWLTLPWNLILPCYGFARSCSLSLGVAFVSAELNAAVLYFLIAMSSHGRDD